MKKILLTILFLTLAACSPGLADAASQLAVATDQVQATPSLIPSAMVSTETPISTSTALPSPTPTLPIDTIVERPYNPGEWKTLYDKNTVGQIQVDPAGRMWISPGADVGYFDGNQWVFFSPKDYLLFPFNYDMEIAPDGTVWVSGLHALSRYQDGRWETFPIPGADDTVIPRITIDASGAVWVSMSSCPGCGNLLKKFDGKSWSDVQLWETKKHPEQILFTPDGALWVVDSKGDIGRSDGKTWKIFSEAGLWSPEEWVRTIQITSDPKGNVYGVSTENPGHVSWITKIDTNGQISKIPVPTKLVFWQNVLRVFVDSQETIWVNACLDGREDYTCLAYYKDNQWVSFTHMPRYLRMVDFKELPDGTLLIASLTGLYQFKSAEETYCNQSLLFPNKKDELSVWIGEAPLPDLY